MSRRIVFLTAGLLLAACSTELPHEAPYDPDAPLEKQAKAGLNGRVTLEGETDFSQVTVELRNDARTYNTDTEADGSVTLTGVVPGTYRLSIRTRYFEPVTETVTVELGGELDLGERELALLRSSVSGLAVSQTAAEDTIRVEGGIAVRLVKTASIRAAAGGAPAIRPAAAAATTSSYATVSGPDGKYQLFGVPAGKYTVHASSEDASDVPVGEVIVTGEGDATVQDIVFKPLTGFVEVEGKLRDGSTSSVYTTSAVVLKLTQSGASQVRVGRTTSTRLSDCLVGDPAPITTSLVTWNTLDEGHNLFCVVYVGADGEETDPVYGTIVSDTTAPALARISVEGGAAFATSTNLSVALNAVDGGSGMDTMVVWSSENAAPITSFYSPLMLYPLAATSTDGTKTLFARFSDKAGNVSSIVSDSIELDTTAPTTPSISIGESEFTTSRSVLLNLSVDGATQMKVGETSGLSGAAWEPYSEVKSFVLSSGQGLKTVYAQFRDTAGWETAIVSDTISIDYEAPSITVFTVNGGAAMANDPVVTVAIDTDDPSAEMRLAESSDFNGASWTAYASPVPFTLSTGNGTKAVYLQLRDGAGNTSAVSNRFIVLDETAPSGASVLVNGGDVFTTDSEVTLAIGGSGADEMQVSENASFAGANWVAFTTVYPHTITGGDGNRNIYLRLRDEAGNYSATVTDSIRLDTQAPTGESISITEKPRTKSTLVTLTLGVSGAAEMILGDDANFSGRSWQPVTTTVNWTLSAGDGTKRVYAKFRDDAGNESATVSDSLILDTTAPDIGTLTVNGGNAVTNSTTVTYSASASESLSLPMEMQASGDIGFGGATWVPYAASGTVTVSAGDGYRTVYVRYRDAAGNISLISSGSFTLDQTGPQLTFLEIEEGRDWVRSNVAIDYQIANWSMGDHLQIDTAADFSSKSEYSAESGQRRFIHSLAAADGEHVLYVRARDFLGNYGTTFSAAVTKDTVPPNLTGTIGTAVVLDEGEDFTRNRLVSVEFNVGGADEMLLSDDPAFTYASWEPFRANTSWVFDNGDGPKQLFARFRDQARNTIGTYVDGITLDTRPPHGAGLHINGGAPFTTSTTVTLTLNALEADTMEISTDGFFDTEVAESFSSAPYPLTLAGEGTYFVYVRYCDPAANCTEPISAKITVDETAPVGSLLIQNGAAYTKQESVALSIVGSDSGSGIQGLRLANSQAALATTDVVPFEPNKLWRLANPLGPNQSAPKTVWMQVLDRAGLASAATSDTIIYDTLPPTGGITLAAAVTKDTLIPVDLTFDADVMHMKLSSGDSCAGGNWIEVSSETVFMLPDIDGMRYVSVRFRDAVLNESTCYVASVMLDKKGPTPKAFVVTGNAGAKAGYTNTTNLSVSGSTLAVDCAYAELSEDVGFISPTGTVSSCTFSNEAYTLLNATDGFHNLYLRYFDSLGNPGPVTQTTIVLDTSMPTVGSADGFHIDEAPYTNIQAVTLRMLASGVDEMSVAESVTCSATWEPYSSTRSLTLSGGDGAKDVSVRYRDVAGNITGCFSRKVTLDTVVDAAPAWSIAVTGAEGGNARTASQNVTVAMLGVDADVTEMKISNSSTFGDASWITYQAVVDWFTTSGDGSKTVYVRIRDAAGNTATNSAAIFLDQSPPDTLVLNVQDTDGDGVAVYPDKIELVWTATSDPNATNIELQRAVNSSFETIQILNPLDTSAVVAITDSVGQAHQFRLRVVDDLGQTSAWSNVVAATPYNALGELYWVRSDQNEHLFGFEQPDGVFSFSPNYRYRDEVGTVEIEPMSADYPFWKRPTVSDERLNETIFIRSANADNSEVIESEYSLGISTTTPLGDCNRNKILADSKGWFHQICGTKHYVWKYGQRYLHETLPESVAAWTFGNNDVIHAVSIGYVFDPFLFVYNVGLRYATSNGWSFSQIMTLPNMFDSIGNTDVDLYADDNLGVQAVAFLARKASTGDFPLLYAANYSGWMTETVNSAVGSIPIGPRVRQGEVFYYDYLQAKVQRATPNYPNWSIATIDSFTPTDTYLSGKFIDLEVDAGGRKHLVYYDEQFRRLKHTICLNASCSSKTTEVVDGAEGVGRYADLSIVGNDLYISYLSNILLTGVKLAKYTSGTGWRLRSIDQRSVFIGLGIAMAANQYGDVLMVYHPGYAFYQRGFNLSNQHAIDIAGATGTRVLVDRDDNVRIIYGDGTDTRERVFNGKTFSTSLVDSGFSFSRGSIGQLPSGARVLVHQGGTALRFAIDTGTGWTAEQVTTSVSVESFDAMAISDDGQLYVAVNTPYPAYQLLVMQRNGAGVWSQMTLPGSYSCNGPNLARDKMGKIHVFCGTKQLTYEGGSWSEADLPITVDTVDFDAEDRIHTALKEGSELAHYVCADGFCTRYLVDTLTLADRIKIRVNDQGLVHLSYFASDAGKVKFAIGKQGKYTSNFVMTEIGNRGQDFAFDSAGKPWLVSYVRDNASASFFDGGVYWLRDFVAANPALYNNQIVP